MTNKKDMGLVVAMSIILTGLMFLSITGAIDERFVFFGDTGIYGNAGIIEQVASWILKFPYIITTFIIWPFVNLPTADRMMSASIIAIFFSPITSLLFWFFIFKGIKKINPSFLRNSDNFFIRHLISLVIFIFLSLTFSIFTLFGL